MKVSDVFLIESPPLPDDWDKSTFGPKTSFAKQVKYAMERAKKIGSGSSRIAFEIKYQGRPTILKIAKNVKGLAQNEFEASMLFNDYYLKSLDITIPGIDYDEENDPPKWLHVEKAEKMTPNKFKAFFSGLKPYELDYFLSYMTGKRTFYLSKEEKKRFQEIYEENEVANSLVDLVGNFDMPAGDLTVLANWGIYKGKPVIIDIGASTEVIETFYS